MKANTVLIGGGILAYLSYRIYKTVNSVMNLKIQIEKILFSEITLDNSKFKVYFSMYNPTNISFSIGNLISDVYFNGTKIGTINYDINRTIYPNQINKFFVDCDVFNQDVLMALLDQLATGSLSTGIVSFDGTIIIAGKSVHIYKDLTIDELIDK